MSERMNKERAKQEIIATRKTYADKKQKLEEKNEFEKSELKRRENKSFIHLYDNKINALDIAIESLDNEWVDVRDRLPKQPYDKIFNRPALRTKPMLVSVNGDDWMEDKLYGTKNATYNQVILAYYSFRDNCWKDDDDDEEIKRDGGIYSCEVIAWKPLPQPYERKE